jgi:hypothetical protein
MMNKDIRKEQLLFRLVDSVFTEPFLLVTYRGRGDEVKNEITDALKETSWGWKIKDYAVNHRVYELSFNITDLNYTLTVAVNEPQIQEPIKKAYIRVTLIVDKLDLLRLFSAIFWPDKVRKSEVSLRDLIMSVMRGLAYIVCDVDVFRDLVRLADHGNILVYHDGRLLTRADLVMRRKGVPYEFVVSYHFDFLNFQHGYTVPRASTSYGIIARGKANFDVLAEAIIDEYWREFIGGGERR